jgi:hypothetical protein
VAAWRSQGHRAVSTAAALLASMVLAEKPPPRMAGKDLQKMPPTGRCPEDNKRLESVGNGICTCRTCGRRFRGDPKPN